MFKTYALAIVTAVVGTLTTLLVCNRKKKDEILKLRRNFSFETSYIFSEAFRKGWDEGYDRALLSHAPHVYLEKHSVEN